ncbi:cupin-like domain-containing protein [Arenibaculum sp.]|uniref:cupin-like domain-containing protein n=1 Tax=Arenibaculum sp. TaxID=2865862 RepID=UPI002E0D89DB|nr:cupin-like domain-containing protein [Arenibaculum sp.]
METERNILKNRDKASIDRLEAGFRAGPLGEAMRRAPRIERRRGLDPDTFEREYRRTAKPVVIEGLMDDWPALRTWNFDYLVSRCGDARVIVDSYSSLKAREVSFRDFVGMLGGDGAPDGGPIYLQEWYYQTNCPFLAEDMPELPIAQYDFRRDLYGERISTNHQLWVGQKGATTRAHQDSYLIDVMHAQIVGEKHWCVMSPEAFLRRGADGEPDFAGLADDPRTRIMQCVLKPGDVIYLPALWWHRIELLSDSVGLGRKCLDVANLQGHLRQRLAELMALALNHDHVKEAHPELYKVVVLRNRAWAKLLDIDLTKLRP